MAVYGLYVHVPFCRKKCVYCDFASIPIDEKLVGPYIRAVAGELEQFPGKLRPRTVFFGGGTPTMLGEDAFQELLRIVKERIDPAAVREWSIEANPATLSEKKIDIAKRAGVNRFSLGVQSLDDRMLRFLGRTHSADDAIEAYALLRGKGITNISVDLMFGVPGTTPPAFRAVLEAIVLMKPEHVSTYGLTYEAGTPLDDARRSGRIKPASEDDELAMYLAAVETLGSAGLKRYEVSNFAKKGFECRHNIAYWENHETLGVGPSAASYIRGVRRSNVRDAGEYIGRINEGRPATGAVEELRGRRKAGEVLYLALRMTSGITEKRFHKLTGRSLRGTFGGEIKRLSSLGVVEYEKDRLRLTDKGFPLADTVLMEFL
jgi:oxygen-independent coproporphyrinogen-3 oxidase